MMIIRRVTSAAIASSLLLIGSSSGEFSLEGDPSCPCLVSSQDRGNFSAEALTELSFQYFGEAADNLNASFPAESYGVQCLAHDLQSHACHDDETTKNYCARPWCYVDPNRCALLSKPSKYLSDWQWSYATCGELDSFTLSERVKSLEGKTFRVGFPQNTGGWIGSYNINGSFTLDDGWTGPVTDFVRVAAAAGGFTINMTRPPEWLREKSKNAGVGSSDLDLCTYAASLGYLDFCVAGFTINKRRSSMTTMFQTTNSPIYLIVFAEEGTGTTWENIVDSAATVFQPFTLGSWFMIFLFVLPVLGMLMLVHEHGAPGSAFPTKEEIVVENEHTGTEEVVTRSVPWYTHIVTSVYMGWLAFWHESYELAVITVGGKINLMGISAFIMLIVAVYTANLAAILTQNIQNRPVENLDEAMAVGYTFCASRKVGAIVTDLRGLHPSRIVPDDDGEPGFIKRVKTFDMMKRSRSKDMVHCDAAIALLEDLEAFHQDGEHCNKTRIGDAIALKGVGFPINDAIALSMVSHLHQQKVLGEMERAINSDRPTSQCPSTTGAQDNSLGIQQLTGVWIIALGFAMLSLLARCCVSQARSTRIKPRKRTLRRYDQWLNPPSYEVVINGKVFNTETNELQLSFRRKSTVAIDDAEESGSQSSN